MNKPITLVTQSDSSLEILDVQKTEQDIFSFQDSLIDCDLDSIIQFSNEKKNQNLVEIKKTIQLKNELYPVVTQDLDGKVLMQAFLNGTALDKSFETRFGHYFSRSRNSLWFKGETSGNVQKIEKIFFDSAKSFFVYIVNQNLAACHEGYYSCFFRQIKNKEFTIIDKEKKI